MTERREKALACRRKAIGIGRSRISGRHRQDVGMPSTSILGRDLPGDTPDYILKMREDFEEEASQICFSGARRRILDTGGPGCDAGGG